ncbi:carboxypeptidase regulatory-like domain-containing protein [Marinicella gelatinilytica]|uniref:carboxypeptidase regulatory-like domain-containing protein n=1 Tax=Marinicella gelatinilytica TaxID=2996017 RepID=UPI002260DE4B|nr:carboxypeptidase regulatory-like domain-containing protein [Marinicella gelatinilytica]MCX7545410.1 carboxypeptidase regulatory-like domain-containing protein [Marinicella gelatinilytica]
MKHMTIFLMLTLSLVFSGLQAKQILSAEQQLQIYQDLNAENLITEEQFKHRAKQLKNQLAKQKPFVKGSGTAKITGQVFSSGSLVSGLLVSLYNADSESFIESQNTDSLGGYSFENLVAGNYYVGAFDQVDNFVNAIWTTTGTQFHNHYDPPADSHISLASGESSVGHNLNLTIGATLTGYIVDSITNDQVDTLDLVIIKPNDPSFYWDLDGAIQYDGLGKYTISGIPGGTYQVFLDRWSQNTQHIPEVYKGIQCNSCLYSALEGIGEPVTLINGVTKSDIDFTLEIGAKIQGFVLDASSSLPLEDPGVVLFTSDNGYHVQYIAVEGTNSNPSATGAYSIGGLLPGTYFAEGSNSNPNAFHVRELYADRPCPFSGCDRMSGTPITVGSKEQRGGIDFLLDHGGLITGTVTDEISGLPITGERPFVQFYDMNGHVAGGAYANPVTGVYTSAKALPAGNYSARTGDMFAGNFISDYIMQKYETTGNIDCPGVTCDLTAVNITVNAYDPLSGSPDPEGDATTTGIDFALNTGLSFSGAITDLSTAAPLAGVHVLVYDDNGLFAHWATTNVNGNFTVPGLPAGTYYAKTNNGSNLPFPGIHPAAAGSWVDILYDGISCPGSGCDVTTGTPIVLGGSPDAGQKSGAYYSFGLAQGGSLAGRLFHSETTVGLSNIDVNVYNSQGEFYGSYESNNGKWKTSGLPSDTYFLVTQGRGALVDVKYGGDYCFDGLCNPLTADPIVLSGNYDITNINMILKPDFIFRSGLD